MRGRATRRWSHSSRTRRRRSTSPAPPPCCRRSPVGGRLGPGRLRAPALGPGLFRDPPPPGSGRARRCCSATANATVTNHGAWRWRPSLVAATSSNQDRAYCHGPGAPHLSGLLQCRPSRLPLHDRDPYDSTRNACRHFVCPRSAPTRGAGRRVNCPSPKEVVPGPRRRADRTTAENVPEPRPSIAPDPGNARAALMKRNAGATQSAESCRPPPGSW